MSFNFEKYRQLLNEVDAISDQLSQLHAEHMACKKGCDLCCMDYKVFPVEYYAIRDSLKTHPVELQPSVDGSCIFLKDHCCHIYENRPVICRTHGLPLLFMNDDQWELSACELNFTSFDDEDFSTENTFPQDRFNSKLFLINQKFIKENQLDYSEFHLIDISRLATDN
ncbi:MAG: YkgJ family cysteine cluster protein [Mangrovibacterium sp.]